MQTQDHYPTPSLTTQAMPSSREHRAAMPLPDQSMPGNAPSKRTAIQRLHQHLRLIALRTHAEDLAARSIVTDDLLRALAFGGPERALGELSDSDKAQLVMILPDLCGELLARRMAAKEEVVA